MIDRIIFFTILASISVPPLISFNKEFFWSKLFTLNVFLLISISLYLCRFFKNSDSKKVKISLPSQTIPFVLLILYSCFSISFISFNKYQAFCKLILISSNIIIYLIISLKFNKEEKFDNAFNLVFITCVFISLYGILQSFDVILAPKEYYGEKDPGSTFNRTNQAAQFLVCFIPYFFIRLYESVFNTHDKGSNKLLKIFWTVGTIIIVYYFIIIKARGSWLGLLAGLIFTLAFMFKINFYNGLLESFKKSIFSSKKKKIIFIIVPILMVSVMSISFAIKTINSSSLNESSLVFRLHAWKSTVNMIKDNPWVGIGIGNYETFLPKYQTEELSLMKIDEGNRVGYAHNDMLHYISEFGIIGSLIFLLIFVIIFRHIFKIIRNENNESLKLRYIATFAGLIGLFVHSLTSYNFQFPIPVTSFVFLISYIESGNKRINDKGIVVSFGKKSVYLLSSIFLLFLSVSICTSFRRTQSEISFADAVNTKKHMSVKMSIPKFSKSIKYNKYNDLAYYHRGMAKGRLDMFDEALADLRRSLEIYPYKGETYRQMGLIYAELKNGKMAMENFKKALQVTPELKERIEKDIKKKL